MSSGSNIIKGVTFGGIFGAIDQRKAAKRAERKRKRANRVERARASVERSIERKRAVAAARQAQASNIAGAVSQGISQGSSQLQGAQSAIGSNLGASISQANRSFVSGLQSFNLRQAATSIEQNAKADAALQQAYRGLVQQGTKAATSAG